MELLKRIAFLLCTPIFILVYIGCCLYYGFTGRKVKTNTRFKK